MLFKLIKYAQQCEQALRPLKDACLLTTPGWWSYEVCFNSTVKQFHMNKNGDREDTTLVGRYSVLRHHPGWQVQGRYSVLKDTTLVGRYRAGTVC